VWYVQDKEGLFTLAGPFSFKSSAAQWAIECQIKGVLIAVDRVEHPENPACIVDRITPALKKLQEWGEVFLVNLPKGFVAVYLCP
jgi:hypothetical protein